MHPLLVVCHHRDVMVMSVSWGNVHITDPNLAFTGTPAQHLMPVIECKPDYERIEQLIIWLVMATVSTGMSHKDFQLLLDSR